MTNYRDSIYWSSFDVDDALCALVSFLIRGTRGSALDISSELETAQGGSDSRLRCGLGVMLLHRRCIIDFSNNVGERWIRRFKPCEVVCASRFRFTHSFFLSFAEKSHLPKISWQLELELPACFFRCATVPDYSLAVMARGRKTRSE